MALALASPALAQDEVAQGSAAQLRALDRLSGVTRDLEVGVGEAAQIDGLAVSVVECRYPVDNPAGDAYAYILIDDLSRRETLFDGWMIASSPALNPFDHMRYDVWVLRCITA
jgi:hypothetical protein